MSNSQLNDGKSEFEFIERINKYLFNEKMKVKKNQNPTSTSTTKQNSFKLQTTFHFNNSIVHLKLKLNLF